VLSTGADVSSSGAVLHLWRATHNTGDSSSLSADGEALGQHTTSSKAAADTAAAAAAADKVAVRYFTAEGEMVAANDPELPAWPTVCVPNCWNVSHMDAGPECMCGTYLCTQGSWGAATGGTIVAP